MVDKFLFRSFTEQAQIGTGNVQIRGDINLCYGYQVARILASGHFLKYFAQIFLYQPGYLLLACCFHAAKVGFYLKISPFVYFMLIKNIPTDV
jgi:hypothetical protein